MNKLRKMEIIGKAQCSDCHFREACRHSMNNGGEDYCSVLIDYVSKEEDTEEEKIIHELQGFECGDCPMNVACDYIQNRTSTTICSMIINKMFELAPGVKNKMLELISRDRNKKDYTLKDLGLGDDNTKATYVEVGGVRGYLGVVFGTEGDWNVILANVNEDGKIEYQTIKLDDLSEITEL